MNHSEVSVLAPIEPDLQPFCKKIFLEKHAAKGETTVSDAFARVARALANGDDSKERHFFEAMRAGFVPAGRIMSSAGSGRDTTWMNCYVQGVGDSIDDTVDGMPSIFSALNSSAVTLRLGGGVGYDFSHLRPSTAWVKRTRSKASGPVSYMRVFHASCKTIESEGLRRGAQMAVLRCDHPDLVQFINAKLGGTELTTFNISVGVTDAFMDAVLKDEMFELVHKARPFDTTGKHQRDDGLWVYETVRARDVWDTIMRNTYSNGEPGVLFLDRINDFNPLNYAEHLAATNPCAEAPLPPNGCCDLGSVDLTKFVRDPFTDHATFDFDSFAKVVAAGVQMLNQVLDLTPYPHEVQKQEALNKRRIGVGVMGLGSALAMLGLRYETQPARDMASKITQRLRDAAYWESIELAKLHGPFPFFKAEEHLKTAYAQTLPEEMREAIREHGLRNSHLVSMAPTGTIANSVGNNISGGIEPIFALSFTRKSILAEGEVTEVLSDAAVLKFRQMFGSEAALPDAFVTALNIPAKAHVDMLVAIAPHVDQSISKTVNVPADCPFEAFKDLYLDGWKQGLKGMTTYRPNPSRGSVLESLDAPEKTGEPAAEAAPTDKVSANPPAAVVTSSDAGDVRVWQLQRRIETRPAGALPGPIVKYPFRDGPFSDSMYLAVAFHPRTVRDTDGVEQSVMWPFEVWLPAGQVNGAQAFATALMITLSSAFAMGGAIGQLLQRLEEINDGSRIEMGTVDRPDGGVAPRFHKSLAAAMAWGIKKILVDAGFLGEDGNELPVKKMAQRQRAYLTRSFNEAMAHLGGDAGLAAATAATDDGKAEAMAPTKARGDCPNCHGTELQKYAGCLTCVGCGHSLGCGE